MTIRGVFSTIWPVALLWVVLIGFAVIADADWPVLGHNDFYIQVLLATFQVLMASIIVRRMYGWDWLAISLATVFVSLSTVWFYSMAAVLWPVFTTAHNPVITDLLRFGLVGSLSWGVVMLLRTPDSSNDPVQQRAEGVAEGVQQERRTQRNRRRSSE